MVFHLKHSNSLIFIDRNTWRNYLLKLESAPKAVLLSAWQQDEAKLKLLEPLIRKLIELGCCYFVCVGKYSECLHDFVDDIILDMSFGVKKENISKVVTTWHDTETDDEVADFFLNSTNISHGLLVAFLGEKRSEDLNLKRTILKRV